MKKIFITILIIIILLVGGIFGAYKNLSKPVSNNTEEKKIEIPLGTGTEKIAQILKENNLIRNELVFKIYVKKNNISNFQAGTYYLSESMTLEEITNILQTGKMYDKNEIRITYLEGKPMWYLAETIAKLTNNTEQDVYKVLSDEEYIDELISKYWFLTNDIKNRNIYYPLEGYLFPDTYAIANKDATVEEIFEKMLDKMEEVLDSYKTEIQKSDYSIHEILTIASIIETESMRDEDRKNISSVIYNRLDEGMSIGSDVTTYYGLKVNMGDRALYQSEIDRYNPYNTRGPQMEGKLPVGPISSVGKNSIEAAIRPNNTEYLYFASDKTGKTYFTKTYSEHTQLVTELQQSGTWYEH